MTAVGQFFIYRVIKEFKQQIAPFALSSRKIFLIYVTMYLGEGFNVYQFLGIIVIILATFYEFLS